MSRLLSLIITLAVAVGMMAAEPQDPQRYTMAWGNGVRTYTMFIPEGATPGTPLIVYTHGYSKPPHRQRPDLNEAAARHGFAVCYPDGAPDTRGRDGWNVGYPSQHNMAADEASFFTALLDTVASRFDLSRRDVFLAGMSNGGDLCYQFAYTCPQLFKAYGSVAGLTFEHIYHAHNLIAAVPFLEIHGTGDKTSMWLGDHDNRGGWGAYIPVPLALNAIAANNRCTTLAVDTIPEATAQPAVDPSGGIAVGTASADEITKVAGSKRVVTRYHYSGAPSGADAILYRIEGGAHRWGTDDLPTSEILCRFFAKYVKR